MASGGVPVAVVGGLGGMFGWGSAEFATKKSVDQVGTITSLAWAHILGTVVLGGLVGLAALGGESVGLPHHPTAWLQVAFFGVLQTTVYFFAYRAFENGQVAVLSPIFASFAGLVALLSVVVFGETVSAGIAPALLAIFAGVMLLNLDLSGGGGGQRFKLSAVPGLRDIAIATALATGWTLGWDRTVPDGSGAGYALAMFGFMAASACALALMTRVPLRGVPRTAVPSLLLVGVGEAVAYFAISVGYANTSHTSVVALLSGASALPTIVLARLFLGERVTRIQTVGALVVIGGVALLTLAA